MVEIADRSNTTAVYENISWDALIPAVSEGPFDLGMTGITIFMDRTDKVDSSAPAMISQVMMIVDR